MNASSSITLSRWWSISSEPYPKTCSLTIPEGRTGLHPVWEGVLGVRTTWKKKQSLLKKTFHITIQAELCDRPHSSSSLRPGYPMLRGGQTPPRVEDSNRPIGWAIEMMHSLCVDGKMSKKTAARPACPFTASSSRGLPSPSPLGLLSSGGHWRAPKLFHAWKKKAMAEQNMAKGKGREEAPGGLGTVFQNR